MNRSEELILLSQSGDDAATESLVAENNGLIWSVARRFVGRGAEIEDLYQLGCVGFLKAVRGFDMGYGTQFSTYAVPKIAGEIRRYLRDDGAVKVSRSVKERSIAIKSARHHLALSLGREPTIQEIGKQTGLTPEEIAIAESATATVESIQQTNVDGNFSLENTLTDSRTEEEFLENFALRQAIMQLPEREATVIKLRYFHGLTQDRTSKILHVSQVQISRIEKKALMHLKDMML